MRRIQRRFCPCRRDGGFVPVEIAAEATAPDAASQIEIDLAGGPNADHQQQ